MRLNFTAKQLTTIIVIFPLVTLLLYGATSYIFFAYTQKKDIELELTNYKKSLLDIEKERLIGKVNSLTQLINYYDTISSTKIKENVKMVVDVASDTANNIYKRYHNLKYDHEIKDIILNALKDIHFEEDIGYHFLLDSQGNALIHDDRMIKGINILDIQDSNGKHFVKEFNKVIKNEGKGFVNYYWHIVNKDRNNPHYNIAYVKKLDCYDWYLGAAEYLKFANKLTKKDIIKYIASNSQSQNSFFFLFDTDENMIFSPTKNMDINLTTYKTKGFHADDKYLYYTNYIPQRDWYLVAAKSLKDLRESIKEKQKKGTIKREDDMNINFYLLGMTWLLSLLLSLYLSAIVKKRLESYEGQINQNKEKLIFQSKQALIGELFSMIAHQWRQPINKIASIIALLRFDLENEEIDKKEIDKSCEEIENSIEFMSETIDDFRTFYKPTTKTKMVNLKALIGRSVLFLKSTIVKNNIKVVQDLEDITFELYRNEFLQVMLNLVKNAVDAIGSQGVVVIRLYKRVDGKIIISVENSGKSIDEKLINKIFDPYFTTKEDSMGLGLYMTKMIIEKHMNGKISVEALKDGTIFTIELSPNQNSK
jgi:signal transduction histidine kinase